MAEAEPPPPAGGSNRLLPLIALVLVLAAWGAVAAGRERVGRLDLSRWGTDLDIPERLAIDEYCSGYFLPYVRAAVVLDAAALGALCWAGVRCRFRGLGVLVAVIWLGSAGWHGLSWAVTSIFAG